LIFNGANVNQQDKYGRTHLRWASYWGHLSVVNLLLEAGADPHIQDNENKTALDDARRRGYNHVVNTITQHLQRQQQIEELMADPPPGTRKIGELKICTI